MHATSRLIALASVTLLSLSCASRIEVRTMAAPNARLDGLRSFRILPGPTRRDGRPTTGEDDPMISNSIANRAIHERVVRAFADRGYTLDEQHADFAVAFYATAREKTDITMWDYGYPFYPRWGRYGPPAQTVTQYTEGSVVIDVVDPTTRELLWRGEGKAELSDNITENIDRLGKAAEAVVGHFPEATRRTVAARP